MWGRVQCGAVAGGVAAAVLAVGAPALAQGGGRPLLPPHPTAEHLPFDGSDCPTGQAGCIVPTIAEMYRRINSVVPVCDHRAPFSLAYLRVTEEWRRRLEAGYFDDAAWTERIDRVFANLYFDAYDAYAAGRRDVVPPAWALAFDAATKREISALGNFFLEFNAHLNRDLPFAIAEVGTTAPDGTSHKPDYDRGNDIVVSLTRPVTAEIVERFDPTTDDLAVFPVEDAVVTVILGWRERTWRNAELLLAAPTPEARQAVADQIERQTVLDGRLMLETQRYRSSSDLAARDAWCARHGGQRPEAYEPGAASLDVRRGRILVRGSRAPVPLSCPWPSLGCNGTVALRRRGRTLGRRAYRLGADEEVALPVRVRDSARGSAIIRLTRQGLPAPHRVTRSRVRLEQARNR